MTIKMYSAQKQSWGRKFYISIIKLTDRSIDVNVKPYELDERTRKILRRKREAGIISETKLVAASHIIV